jgi:hypothetical protein
MNKPEPKKTVKKKSPGKSKSTGARWIGYVAAIIVMFIIIYLLRHAREWGLTFLNEDFTKCLFYIELSIYATIVANVLFILYDNRWFKHLVHGITNIFGALSLIMIYVIFPFNIADETWIRWIKIGLLIVFGLTVIGVIVELVKGIRHLAKDPQAV